jgi:hypothetical protein
MAEAGCTGTNVAFKVSTAVCVGFLLMLAPVHVQVKQHISMARMHSSRITQSDIDSPFTKQHPPSAVSTRF